jgi:hypothetical protein
MVEGYSHELCSAGFWPGGGEEGAFYSYAYPEPDGYRDQPVRPAAAAAYHPDAGQFLLPYEVVRHADDPDAMLLAFFQSHLRGRRGLRGVGTERPWKPTAMRASACDDRTHGTDPAAVFAGGAMAHRGRGPEVVVDPRGSSTLLNSACTCCSGLPTSITAVASSGGGPQIQEAFWPLRGGRGR